MLSLCDVGAADSLTQSASASFRELFGLEQAQAIAEFGSETTSCLADALEDFNLVLMAKDPVHAKTDGFSVLTDGGTTHWRHACYDLTILKSLTSFELRDGTWLHGYIQGPSLRLKLGPKVAQSQPIARTRFTFLQRVPPNKFLERTREE